MRCSSSEMMENLFFKASKDLVQLEHCFSSPGIQPTCLPCPCLVLAGPLAGPGSPRDASTRGTCRVPAQLHILLPLQSLCCSEVDLGLFLKKKNHPFVCFLLVLGWTAPGLWFLLRAQLCSLPCAS